ncbi:MAG TPA: diacylglycerol kinase family protein, partial [Hyphomicrobiales bacterium]|nr:diacylglycerol kinase family protein [Hyphomicrobiales bacterium]
MRVHAIINKRAGSALSLNCSELAREAQAAFARRGHELTADIVEPEELEATAAAAFLAAPDVLLAAGGDGTVRSVAKHVIGTGTALAILPLGTVNRLAHDLGIPLWPFEALNAIAAGEFREIDAGEVNGRIFLCNSLLGLPPDVSTMRQHLRGQRLLARTLGYLKLLRTIVSSRKHIELTIDDKKTKRRVRVLSLAVSNNLYRHEPTLVFTRQRLNGGVLGVYIAKPRSGLGLLWVLMRAALGLWSGDSRLDSISASRVIISSHRKRIRL